MSPQVTVETQNPVTNGRQQFLVRVTFPGDDPIRNVLEAYVTVRVPATDSIQQMQEQAKSAAKAAFQQAAVAI